MQIKKICKSCNEVDGKIRNISSGYERSVQGFGSSGKKLFLNLMVCAFIRLYLYPKREGEKRKLCTGVYQVLDYVDCC